mmetsp:Transcript_44011/g.68816  ORF Transcript_44011/g.68816 Transcript_44011/m.68816 type:complete len:196 (-) Transcript_44011:123-710(-)
MVLSREWALLLLLGLAVLPLMLRAEHGNEFVWEWRGNLAHRIIKEGSCELQAQKEDEVFVRHAGFLEETGLQFDGSGPEALKIILGRGLVIRGMEMGIEGMCIGEQRAIRIPPELAFDDPQKPFKKKPVKKGSVVEYQIELSDILRPGSFRYIQTKAYTQFGIPGIVALLVALWALYSLYQEYKKKQARKSGKRK